LIIGSNEYTGVSGFLRFLVFFGLLFALFVLVVLPLALSPILTQMVRDAGLKANSISVTVAPLDPTLLLGRARKVTLVADGVDMAPAKIGHLQVAVGDVSYFDRSFATVEGEMDDVELDANGETAHVSRLTVNGPAESASAVAHLTAGETEQLIRPAARRAGLSIDAVDVSDSGVTVTARGLEASARLAVHGGALLLDPGVGAEIVLLQPAPSDAWQLSEAWIAPDGLNVRGVVDVRRLTEQLADT